MDIRICNRPVFDVPVTSEHIAALSTLSAHHYDWKCKAAGTGNGFLVSCGRIIKNKMAGNALMDEDDKTVATVAMTFDEIDTCLKILEGTGLAIRAKLLSDKEAVLCREMQRDLSGAASLANSKYAEWQAIYSAS